MKITWVAEQHSKISAKIGPTSFRHWQKKPYCKKTTVGVLDSKSYYRNKKYKTTNQIYEKYDKVSIKAEQEKNATTLHTIKPMKATRYLSTWIPLACDMKTQYMIFIKIIDQWKTDATQQTLTLKEGRYALHVSYLGK